jgi:hypothetical protein
MQLQSIMLLPRNVKHFDLIAVALAKPGKSRAAESPQFNGQSHQSRRHLVL